MKIPFLDSVIHPIRTAMLMMLRSSLRSGDTESVLRLSERPDPKTVDLLLEALQDDDLGMKYLAVLALTKHNVREGIIPVLGLLKELPTSRTTTIQIQGSESNLGYSKYHAKGTGFGDDLFNAFVANCLHLLSLCPPPSSTEVLEKILGANDIHVLAKRYAIDALGRIKTQESRAMLFGLTQSDSEQIRKEAAVRLAFSQDPETIPFLMSAMQSVDKSVRYNAVEGLARLNAMDAIASMELALSVETDEFVRHSLNNAIRHLNSKK